MEGICPCGGKFFPSRVDPILEGVCCPGKETRRWFCKNGRKNGEVDPYILKVKQRHVITTPLISSSGGLENTFDSVSGCVAEGSILL